MNKEHDQNLIERFLWGQLTTSEGAVFQTLLQNDGALRHYFEEETVFESLFYDMSWGMENTPGFDSTSDWAAAAVTEQPSSNGDLATIYSTAEWQGLIDSAFSEVAGEKKQGATRARTSAFPRRARFLAAACLLGVIGAGIAVRLLSSPPPRVASHSKTPKTVAIALERSAANSNVRPTTARPSLVFDSMVIYSSSVIAGKPISTKSNDGLVRLGEKTAILLDKNLSVAVTARSDSAIAISLSRGSALFTVEKHRYSRFSVATPACDIAVTGTIFRLSVQDTETIVSVLEGSVKAKTRTGSSFFAIPAGMSARIRLDTIMLENGDTAATLLSRSNLLRDFLKENCVRDDGRLVRSGMTASSDTAHGRDSAITRENGDQSQK